MASDGEQQQEQQQQQQEAQPRQEPPPEKPAESLAEMVFGKSLDSELLGRRWLALPLTVRVLAVTGGLAAVLFLPYLGAVGLWDCWETHYGEVARMMIARQDYVFPWWENAWFFSKPPLTMWMQALGMKVVGALDGAGELGRFTEWGMRVPFALLSITAVALLSLAVSRVVSLRAGLATGFVLVTMPLYFLLTRQTVTDTPFVTTMVCAMACALIGQLDETTKHRTAWWYGFYVFLGLSVLAKGLLGGLSAAILLLYALLCVVPWSLEALREHALWLLKRSVRKEVREGRRSMPVLWGQFFRMRLGTGILVFAAVAVPWYLTLSLFDGVDDEGKGFFYRFFIHDHLNRLTAGVHTTTPGGTFIYFIEQGGYAIFPWVALLPGAFAVVSRLRLRSASKADHLALVAVLWVAASFLLLASSATKFHHYIFPVLPGLAILLALFADRLWQDGPAEHAVSLIFGLVLFILVGRDLADHPKNFTDLFVYNYDRPYPTELVNKPIPMFQSRALWMGDLLAVVVLGVGLYLSVDAFFSKNPKDRTPAARSGALLLLLGGASMVGALSFRGKVSLLGLLGIALLLVAAFNGWQALRASKEERAWSWILAGAWLVAGGVLAWRGFARPAGADTMLRALMEPVNIRKSLGFAFTVGGALCAVAALRQARNMLFGSFWVMALGLAVWFNWSHWVDLSHHWTQRDLFWRYWRQRQAGEPIAAFMMNWRGETFYSRNQVEQFRSGDANMRMRNFVAPPGREWALVEHGRLGVLNTAVGSGKKVTVIERDLNNKFVLVTID